VHPRTGDLAPGQVVWTPPADARRRFVLGRYLDWLAAEHGHDFAGYHDLHRWSVTDLQVHLDHWSDRRVALIGDAAHAAGPGGNGTGNAVVAAAILAGELAASPGDHQAALARYEQRLRPYVTRAQKQAADSQAFLAPATWQKIRRRNLFYKALPYLPVTGFIRRSATKTAAAITLPDYGPARS
jgi:2-polyprenyl-6-methoxyphenol hydroxylase-like FAD-dependent oxidoreductase